MTPSPSLLDACRLASAASFAEGRYGLQGWFTLPDVMKYTAHGAVTYDNGIARLDALVKTGVLHRATWDEALGLSSAALYRLVAA